MLTTALAALVAAVLAGAGLAYRWSRSRPTPSGAGYAHGAVATLGVTLLLAAVFSEPTAKSVNAAALLLALALLGGGFVLVFRLQGERPPGFMVALHAGCAVVGTALLAYGLSN
jgi:hypothetical protein